MRKCKGCGYHKNPPQATHCNLCGQAVSDEMPDHQDLRLGKAKVVETKDEGKPRADQIVYAGDFAIVYAFVPVNGANIILQPGEVFTFGRGDNCDFKIDSKTVSRRSEIPSLETLRQSLPRLVRAAARKLVGPAAVADPQEGPAP